MNPDATILDKQIYVYDPQVECTEQDIEIFLSRFNRLETARRICDIACRLHDVEAVTDKKFNGIPVNNVLVCDTLHRSIIYCKDEEARIISDEEVSLLFNMCFKLTDGVPSNSTPVEILLKVAYQQFKSQENPLNNFTRNYYIFTDLWYKLGYNDSIDISSSIESVIGVSYDKALLFAYAIIGCKDSYFRIIDNEKAELLSDKTGVYVTPSLHATFIDWCSADYFEIQNDNSQFPHFLVKPIIKTGMRPVTDETEVYLVASKEYLHDKLTYGLYFHLSKLFDKGGRDNLFKTLFGDVFQEYVGELLHYHFDTWEIGSEVRYKKGKHQFHDTVDWLLLKDDRMVLIEVKQSSIFMDSKLNPSLKNIRSNFKNTIFKAISQLEVTESDIRSCLYPELHRYRTVKHFTKLVVLNDPVYLANHVLRSFMADEIDAGGVQVVNINDFELLLSKQQSAESLFDLLSYKSLEYPEMDFKEFTIKMFPGCTSRVEFLDHKYLAFTEKMNIQLNA